MCVPSFTTASGGADATTRLPALPPSGPTPDRSWPDAEVVQQAVGQLPWGHNLVLLTKLKDAPSRLVHAQRAIQHGWSRNMLNIHIETRLIEREGKALTNFEAQLPTPQSDLAHEALKDPYLFDFLGVGKEADERAIESASRRW